MTWTLYITRIGQHFCIIISHSFMKFSCDKIWYIVIHILKAEWLMFNFRSWKRIFCSSKTLINHFLPKWDKQQFNFITCKSYHIIIERCGNPHNIHFIHIARPETSVFFFLKDSRADKINGKNTRYLTVTTDLIPVVSPPLTSHLSMQPKPKLLFSFFCLSLCLREPYILVFPWHARVCLCRIMIDCRLCRDVLY